jgi:hypothetical protein
MSADPFSTPQWRAFLRELDSKGVDFALIQHADDLSRAEVVASCTSLSVLDRAVVSSTWAKIARGGGASDPSSMRQQPHHSPQTNTAYGDTSGYGASSYTHGSPPRSYGQSLAPVASDPTSLRAALTRGDSTSALPLASELLQDDPASLCIVLQEYLPHMTVDQIRGILGLGAPAGGGANAAQQAKALNVSGGGSGPTLNGKPIGAGQVLTAQSLAAQFGAGFTATSNGAYLAFPHTVQQHDTIVVRGLTDRLL